MNEELQNALAKIIETTLSAKDFVLEQAPDIIHQLLAWKFTVSLIWFCLFLVIFVAVAIFNKKMWSSSEIREDDDLWVLCGAVSLTTIGVSFCFLANSITWLQIWIAPKVYLLEYASTLIK